MQSVIPEALLLKGQKAIVKLVLDMITLMDYALAYSELPLHPPWISIGSYGMLE